MNLWELTIVIVCTTATTSIIFPVYMFHWIVWVHIYANQNVGISGQMKLYTMGHLSHHGNQPSVENVGGSILPSCQVFH